MKRITLIFIQLLFSSAIFGCTNILVTKGASADGSAYLVYTNDAEYTYCLYKQPAKDYAPGLFKEYTNEGSTGKIPQVEHTYAILGFHMNEFQLAIGETTFTGRLELWNHKKFLNYFELMKLALERAKTAREAIKVITEIIDKYGYGSEGESFSIVDKEEAWILEMVGTGNGGEGAIWVAQKIPDGMISAHANKARIGTFKFDDPENCLYSKNVVTFAIEKGYYNPKTDGEFKFNEAYCPSTPSNLRYCSSRVWSIFNRAAPSLHLSSAYHRGERNAQRYPLWIKPDKKLSTADMISLVRDHYEGTEFDMTKGLEAGAFGNPNRNRPLVWEVDGVDCSWERPISTYNSAFTFIAQIRPWLPDNIGGVVWYGVDDSYVTCYVPLYNSITEIPKAFAIGDIKKFSWKSAFWVFNFVANYSNLRYSYMIKDLQIVQDSLESNFLKNLSEIDDKALLINKKNPLEASKFLTEYDVAQTEIVMNRWIQLGEELITKYNDGYIKNSKGEAEQIDYPDTYKRDVIKNRPSVILPVWDEKEVLKSPDSY